MATFHHIFFPKTPKTRSQALYELRVTVVAVQTMAVMSSARVQVSVLPAALAIAEQTEVTPAPTAAPSWRDVQ